ncbi:MULTISPECIES: RND family transporter [Corallococcus]|uniref:efflux RND transporter permease subunit n=1 Tax=Corallococcus TaxID=83461 RepID=UPI001377D660|nr:MULTISPECIES: MMPL family transporter [Corallococcus]NBD09626.1 MMPL family transporter [Corallococcus silvisoli]
MHGHHGHHDGRWGASRDQFAHAFVSGLVRHRRAILGIAALMSVVGVALTVSLYGDLRSEVEELLPSTAPSVVSARVLGPRLYDVNHLSVVLEGDDPAALRRFADAFAARVRALPPTLVREVEYRSDAELDYVRRFGLFYLSVEQLQTLIQRVRARLDWEKRHANPFVVDLLGNDTPPSLDLPALAGAAGGGALASVERFKNGYFQSADGKRVVLLIRPPEATTGYAFNHALLERVRAEAQALSAGFPGAPSRIGYDGEVATMTEEQASLRQDLVVSGMLVLGGVSLVLWLYFRRWRAIAALVGSLAVGCAVTFGLAKLLIGYLNANTAFLGSIVVGNGINAAIIFMARYLEERRDGLSVDDALPLAWSRTLEPTFVASFAAGLAYLSLMVTRFRGFNQFGIIGGLGMALCWAATYVLLPPLLVTLEGQRPMDFTGVRGAARLTETLARLVERHRRWVRGVALALLLGSMGAIATYRGPLVEADFNKLRARDSQKNGSIYWGQQVDAVFQTYLTPIAIVADTPADLQRVVGALDARQRALGTGAPVGEVRTASTLMPQDPQAKLPLLRELRRLLPDDKVARLPPADRDEASRFLPPVDARPPTWEDLPATIRQPLTERDGTVGRIAFAYPKRVGAIDATYGTQLTELIRGAIQDAGGHALATGRPLLISDINQSILRDGPRATLLAFAAVTLLVLVVVRRPAYSVAVLVGLLLGVAWLIGLAAALRLRLNFLNFVVLPITFGIGVDYAANLVLRYRQEGPGSFIRVMDDTGGAVALCSSTTIIGYASLIFSNNQALAGFGLLATLGEVACLSAGLLALPAFFFVPSTPPGQSPRARDVEPLMSGEIE